MDEKRISVVLTQLEMDQLFGLAQRRGTSVAVLGQLAIRQLLVQSRNGAVPMLRPLEPAPALSNLERSRHGRLTSMAAWRTEAAEAIDSHQAALNLLDAKAILERLSRQ